MQEKIDSRINGPKVEKKKIKENADWLWYFCITATKISWKNDTGQVTAPIGITEERSHQWEQIDGPGPLADTIGCTGIVLFEYSSQEQHQVHTNTEKC